MRTPTPLEQLLTYRLHRAAKLVDRDEGEAYASACGLGVSEARCLVAIGSFEPLSLVDLARAANQDKGQASRTAQALVGRGLVRKESSTADARSVALTLTRGGRQLHARALKALETRNQAIFTGLAPAERKTLGALLDRVATAIDAKDPQPG